MTIDLFPAEVRSEPAKDAGAQSAPALEQPSKKVRKRELKRLYDAVRPLEGWERYRALIDATDEAYELIDISNREVRFALLLMGALNAVPAVLLTRSEALALLSTGEKYALGAVAVTYALMTVAFLFQAVEALRPGHFRPQLANWAVADTDFPAGVRYFEDVVQHTASEYWKSWQTLRLSQLNAELAVQLHSLAKKNDAKHRALRHLFVGLRAMTLLLVLLLLMFVWFAWT